MIRYIADMHFDNADIIAYDDRPFDDVAAMNAALIERWNRVVGDEDLTWILGDFCAGDAARWREVLTQLRGKKALILGNHDDAATAEAVRDCLEDVAQYKEIADGEEQVVLCHYPMPSFHDHYFGWIHLFGHVHNAFEANIVEHNKRLLKKLYAPQPACRMANVGAMLSYMDYTPRTLEELRPRL